MHKYTLDIEIHETDEDEDFSQAIFLVHGYEDVFWTNSAKEAVEWLKHDLERLGGVSSVDRIPSIDDRIKVLQDIKGLQGSDGNWNCDNYMHGMYNGLEMASALMQNRIPEFRVAPKNWLFRHARWSVYASKLARLFDKLVARFASNKAVSTRGINE